MKEIKDSIINFVKNFFISIMELLFGGPLSRRTVKYYFGESPPIVSVIVFLGLILALTVVGSVYVKSSQFAHFTFLISTILFVTFIGGFIAWKSNTKKNKWFFSYWAKQFKVATMLTFIVVALFNKFAPKDDTSLDNEPSAPAPKDAPSLDNEPSAPDLANFEQLTWAIKSLLYFYLFLCYIPATWLFYSNMRARMIVLTTIFIIIINLISVDLSEHPHISIRIIFTIASLIAILLAYFPKDSYTIEESYSKFWVYFVCFTFIMVFGGMFGKRTMIGSSIGMIILICYTMTRKNSEKEEEYSKPLSMNDVLEKIKERRESIY